MQKHIIGVAMAAAAFGAASPAFAEFGEQGDVSFAADRLMGVYWFDYGPADGVTAGIAVPAAGIFPYTLPRLGIDFFLIDGLSLGGTLGLWVGEGDDGVLLHPRVGYAVGFSDSFGIWPRGGITFWKVDEADRVALTAEAMFFATPGEQWGFLFGPTFDVDMAGDSPKGLSFGIMTAGVFGWF